LLGTCAWSLIFFIIIIIDRVDDMINLGKKSINLKNSKKNDLEKKGKR
jgi:hypothetical protein